VHPLMKIANLFFIVSTGVCVFVGITFLASSQDLECPICPACAAPVVREESSTYGLTRDARFTASEKYWKMEELVRSNYDLDTLRRDFAEKGYVTFKPNWAEGVLDSAQAFTQHVLERCAPNNGTPALDCRDYHQDRFTDQASVKALALNPDVLAVLAVLHGRDPFPFQTLNYPKTSLARTHSDYVHFAAHPLPLMAAVWVAIIDVHPDAGPVFYYEGSHRLPPFNMQDFGLDDRTKGPLNYPKYQDIMAAYMKKLGYEYREAVIPRGHVFIWSANLVHGGPPAKIPSLPRHSQVTHYFFRNSSYLWVPVASHVQRNEVMYYDEAQIDRKWSDEGTAADRRSLSKFKIGTCDPKVPGLDASQDGPCAHVHRMPNVMSDIFIHKGETDNDVIM